MIWVCHQCVVCSVCLLRVCVFVWRLLFTSRSAELSDLPLASLTYTHTHIPTQRSKGHHCVCVCVCTVSLCCLLSLCVCLSELEQAAAAAAVMAVCVFWGQTSALIDASLAPAIKNYQVLKDSALSFSSSPAVDLCCTAFFLNFLSPLFCRLSK